LGLTQPGKQLAGRLDEDADEDEVVVDDVGGCFFLHVIQVRYSVPFFFRP
jgi:hypothetical protein